MPAQFSAAADFLSPGGIATERYDDEIFDLVRRSSVALNRIKHVPATGALSRYFEQTAIAQGSFVAARTLSATPAAPTRIENAVNIKAITNQTNIALFDKEVTQQQKQFKRVVAKDITDVVNGTITVSAAALWNGNDTNLLTPTTLEYMGGLNQITQTATVAPGASIIRGIKSLVAAMVGNPNYVVKPSALYLNAVLNDYIDAEAQATKVELKSMDVMAGVTVDSIATQAGRLPLISDAYMPSSTVAAFGFGAPPAGYKNYFLVITMEDEVEFHYVSGPSENPNPRLFELGLTGNLNGQFMSVLFDAPVFKGPSYAHAVLCVQRP